MNEPYNNLVDKRLSHSNYVPINKVVYQIMKYNFQKIF